MRVTPLHLTLGVNEVDLSADLVQTACDQAVKEREDLDWKATLPLTLPAENTAGRNEQQDELAKDIAAMANTRGGLIIYGVAETRGTNAAAHIQSVGEPSDQTLQNIRRVASNLIHPPVTGLSFTWLPHADGKTVLALGIQASADAPHMVRPKKQPSGTGFWFAVPYRNGPDTDWMPEKMIESAYRDRLANRRQRQQDVHQLHTNLASATAIQDDGAWIVAIARPDNPLPARPRLLHQRRAAGIFGRAWGSPWRHLLKSAVSAEMVLRDVQTRRGLRSFRQTGVHRTTVRGSSQGVIKVVAELHYDGSVGLALTRGGALGPTEFPDKRFLVSTDLDQAALNLFTLARQTSQDLGVVGDYEVLLSVEARAGVLFRHFEGTPEGHIRPFNEDDRVPPFLPVEGVFETSGGLDAALESLEEIAHDAVNQTGAPSQLNARDLRLQHDLDD